MPINDLSERKFLGFGLIALACSAGALTAALSAMAFDHMTGAVNLCGSPAQHCSACFGAVASFLAALMTGRAGLAFLTPPWPRVVRP